MSFDARIARARLLAERHPAAADILSFYRRVLEYQRDMVGGCSSAGIDRRAQIALVPALLSWLEREAPGALAASASDLRRLTAEEWNRWFDSAFGDGHDMSAPADAATLFVAEAIQQPFAEREVAGESTVSAAPFPAEGARATCPRCGCRPVVGVLREAAHGARRSLVCVRCATEWPYPRVTCPGCGEDAHDRLPVFTAESFAHIRVEACDRCRRYLKTVDLSQDGYAVPVVDDLAAVALDLWVQGEGYLRLRSNLLRT